MVLILGRLLRSPWLLD